MNVINDQREVLINLRSEVDAAEGRLEKASRAREEMKRKREDAEKKQLLAEKNQRKILLEKKKMEDEIMKLEKDKIKIKQNLGIMEIEANSLSVELITKERKIARFDELNLYDTDGIPYSRLQSGLAPLLLNVSARKSELSNFQEKLEEKRVELMQMQQRIVDADKLVK